MRTDPCIYTAGNLAQAPSTFKIKTYQLVYDIMMDVYPATGPPKMDLLTSGKGITGLYQQTLLQRATTHLHTACYNAEKLSSPHNVGSMVSPLLVY